MGHAIANTFAMHGYPVRLYEAFEPVRNSVKDRIRGELEFMVAEDYISATKIQETLDNITIYDDLAQAVQDADYVIEATPEDLKLKQELFHQLDQLCPPNTILSSNTSSLPLSDMSTLLSESRKSKIMVCHWYNPGHLIPIAELSAFGNMSKEDFDQVYELYIRSEKQPIKILKDIPGLIANRMLHALAREVFSLMEMGAASPEDIDRALKFGPGFRNATAGMLEIADMGGLDIWCTVEDNLFKELNHSERACDMIRTNVKSGNLGLKTGKGFFEYSEEKRAEVQNQFNRRLITQLKASKNY
jgi:3-hydroxybutyryl-CoA dehydrogenase